jgi:hypothetical protein
LSGEKAIEDQRGIVERIEIVIRIVKNHYKYQEENYLSRKIFLTNLVITIEVCQYNTKYKTWNQFVFP